MIRCVSDLTSNVTNDRVAVRGDTEIVVETRFIVGDFPMRPAATWFSPVRRNTHLK
jgi:hypothetical protein